MLPRPPRVITEDDLQSLIDGEVLEMRGIEYKEKLPGGTEADKKEFLADAVSFANAGGGDIIFGMRAEDGVPKGFVPIGHVKCDDAMLRLEQLMRDGIQPRVPGVHAISVRLHGGSDIVVLRIPASWAGPHMVKYKGSQRFYSRSSNGKYPLDVFEIGELFASSRGRTDRVRDFRLERMGRIIAGETPVRLPDGPRTVLHIVPLSPPTGGVDVCAVASGRTRLRPMYYNGGDSRYNLEGLLSYKALDSQGASDGYTQLYRNGAIEAVEWRYLAAEGLWGSAYERMVIEACSFYMNLLNDLGVPAPVAILLTLLGVQDFPIQTRSNDSSHVIDRDSLLLPEIIVEELPESVAGQLSQDVAKVLRPCFDALWNAAGYPRSLSYDQAGEWAPK